MNTSLNDVTIIGGGLAGLTLALQLKQRCDELSINVIEKNHFPVPEACHKVGESSVEIGAFYFAKVLKQLEHIEKEQLPKFGLRYFFSNSDNSDISQRLEVGGNIFFPTPSYQLDRGRFENHLAQEACKADINLITGQKIEQVELSKNEHKVYFNKNSQCLTSKWLIDCSGRAGLIKKLNNGHKKIDHNLNAAWFRVDDQINIDQWSNDPSWIKNHKGSTSRMYSTNHLMGAGYWVWIIPLASGQTSIGIVADQSIHPISTYNSKTKALDWLKVYEPQAGALISTLASKITDFLAVKNYCYGTELVFSEQQWCLSGEAGVFLDPFYSPGSDFIAISNTFITDLIVRSYLGESVSSRIKIYNQLYLSYFKNTLPIFQYQYPLFGHTRIMPIKIIWDYATYWSQLAFIFIQGYLCNLSIFNHTRQLMAEVGVLNAEMQKLFREKAVTTKQSASIDFIDLSQITYLYELNESLREPLSEKEFVDSFKQKVYQLRKLSTIMKELLNSMESIPDAIESNMPVANKNTQPLSITADFGRQKPV